MPKVREAGSVSNKNSLRITDYGIMIAIIDYGMGNIHSVQKALTMLGEETLVTSKPGEIKRCQKIVLPGVGAFDDAVSELRKTGLIKALKEEIKNKKIFLGICLGMQLLFEASAEAKQEKGMGILPGKVLRFSPKPGFKVPHMGWNQIKIKNQKSKIKIESPLLKGLPENPYVYFCHSYYPQPEDDGIIAATTDYGLDFASMVCKDNIFGVQFHPEKSQSVGLQILKNFVELC